MAHKKTKNSLLAYLIQPKPVDASIPNAANGVPGSSGKEGKEHSSRLSGAISSSMNLLSLGDLFKDSKDGSKNVKFPEKLLKVLEQRLENIAMGKDAVYVPFRPFLVFFETGVGHWLVVEGLEAWLIALGGSVSYSRFLHGATKTMSTTQLALHLQISPQLLWSPRPPRQPSTQPYNPSNSYSHLDIYPATPTNYSGEPWPSSTASSKSTRSNAK